MALTRTYGDNATRDLAVSRRARLGGPRLPHTSTAREELIERVTTGAIFGSHMPLDTEAHWDWRNPLNIIPALILLLVMIALVAAIV
jgi:hypothetical protein